jgi:tetratricopeptide (TPR) repeat protein
VKRLAGTLALFAALALAPTARAADEARFTQLADEGAASYRSREFEKAIESFEKAYALEPDPNLLFNIARCREALGENAAAIDGFEKFLRAEGGDPQGRAKAEEELARLRKQSDHTRPSYLVPAIVVLGVGAVAATVGAIVYAGGISDHNDVTGAANYEDPNKVYGLTRGQAQGLVDSGDRKKLVGGITMGVGGALLAAGIVLVVLDRRAATIAVAPTQGGAFAAATGRF